MKKIVLTLGIITLTQALVAQQQVGNSNFESWETVSSGEEPVNWNSFLTAGGAFSFAAGDQLNSSTDVRPGSSGTKSAHLFSNDVFGVIANGNLTVGKINMGSATPTNANNYNSSIITDAAFSETLTNTPDSLVFWAKFTPANAAGTDSARVRAAIHDNYAFRDPSDVAAEAHIVATATKNYATTNGNWVRMSVPFIYSGPASTPEFLLITFTTNKTPGGGSDNDQVWIDDMELIYNSSASVAENTADFAQVSIQNHQLVIKTQENVTGNVAVYQANGQLVHEGTIGSSFTFEQAGVYFVKIASAQGVMTKKVVNY
ncbi:MAG TPA: T9SS type A sorting domain-containing protein [Fluviicola sp.]|nr:T9SS type A sorting domain-containing protein [Fluviicola sp.]